MHVRTHCHKHTHTHTLKGHPPSVVCVICAGGWPNRRLCFRTTQETPIMRGSPEREWGRVTNFTFSFLLSPAVSSNGPLMWEIKKSQCVNISLRPTTLIYSLSVFSCSPPFPAFLLYCWPEKTVCDPFSPQQLRHPLTATRPSSFGGCLFVCVGPPPDWQLCVYMCMSVRMCACKAHH